MKEYGCQGRTVLGIRHGDLRKECILRNGAIHYRAWDIEFKYPKFGTVGYDRRPKFSEIRKAYYEGN